MTAGAGTELQGGDRVDPQAHVARLVAGLSADWLAWREADEADEAERVAAANSDNSSAAGARARCAQGLRELLQVLGAAPDSSAWAAAEPEGPEGQAGGVRSLVAALQALQALVDDPMASLPGHLGTALVLTHERLADLRLQQLVAAEDPNWMNALLQPVQTAAISAPLPAPAEPVMEPESTQGGRDWWAIPMEGLTGSNQMFLLETRELLRSAELSFQALQREPGDYGEQMVLCRSFQAVSVAAASMGLHRVAKLAAEGETRFDDLLDRGGICDAESLLATEELLSGLFRELMELVGEPVVEVAASALQPLMEPSIAPELDPPTEPVRMPEQAPEQATEQDAPTEPPEQRSEEPARGPAPEHPPAPPPEPEQPPWWWAMDWSAWERQALTHPPNSIGAEALMQVLQTAAQASEAAAAVLRIPPTQLHAWADRLRTGGHDAALRKELVDELEDASCVPLESWSVALFRTARRVAREAGQPVDFDIEGASVRGDAALMQHLMPRLEEWVGLRVAQSLGHPLRLRATHEGPTVVLQLGDGHSHPWPESVLAQAQDLAVWLAARGGALRADTSGWQFAMPAISTRMPLLAVPCGPFEVHLPALWVVSQQTFESYALGQALEAGSLEHQGLAWPATSLAALLRQEPNEQAAAQVLWVQHGEQRLALIVEDVKAATVARPLAWPAPLVGLKSRSGMWGLAAPDAERLLLVIDPFALHDRFGAAARVLARTRSRRARA